MKRHINSAPVDAVGIVVPVHNEEHLLPHALQAISKATARLPRRLQSRTAVVLDSCTDASVDIANRWADESRASIVSCDAANVGVARRLGCEALLHAWDHVDPNAIWLATTDADSQVPADWLVAQLQARVEGADMWTGRVEVADWSTHRRSTSVRWIDEYREEFAPIHGANMGLTARTYLEAGGFQAMATGEDRALHQSARNRGARVHHDQLVKVVTSARRIGRAPLGFAHALASVEAAESLDNAPTAGLVNAE
jgi:glycosyltransferase involved in cell wall biosynthesis